MKLSSFILSIILVQNALASPLFTPDVVSLLSGAPATIFLTDPTYEAIIPVQYQTLQSPIADQILVVPHENNLPLSRIKQQHLQGIRINAPSNFYPLTGSSVSLLNTNPVALPGANIESFGARPLSETFGSFFAKPNYQIIGPSVLNAGAFSQHSHHGGGVLTNLGIQSYVGGTAIKPSMFSTLDLTGSHLPLLEPGATAQMSQVPCTLHIPSPIPLTVTSPSGAGQVTSPSPSPPPPSPSSTEPSPLIPASFIDNSPPTIGVLAPPTSDESTIGSETIAIPAAAASSSLLKSVFRPSSPRMQEQKNADSFKTTEDATEDLARNGFPIVYALLPTSGTATMPSSTLPTFQQNKRNSPSSISSSTAQRNNPYFSVNKRKHFELYQYF